MTIDKDRAELLLSAITDSIRYAHMTDSPYDVRHYSKLHYTLVCKTYRSSEMRIEKMLPQSILEGTDLGLCSTVSKVHTGKAPIVEKLKDILTRLA